MTEVKNRTSRLLKMAQIIAEVPPSERPADEKP